MALGLRYLGVVAVWGFVCGFCGFPKWAEVMGFAGITAVYLGAL